MYQARLVKSASGRLQNEALSQRLSWKHMQRPEDLTHLTDPQEKSEDVVAVNHGPGWETGRKLRVYVEAPRRYIQRES